MARITVEDCLDRLNNRFALVLLVAKRTKQLLKGAEPTISTKDNKYVVTALREVAAGNVTFSHSYTEQEVIEQVQEDLAR